ncbi:SusC/RagA family TonB-linked outer membrane protein [Draconibacterium sediminis]|uniref:TonB-dependent receptor n=1 Tax=Draconibacterium sediminis TaxID=1544798 RepID=A0A0D8JAC9_9BACT|nr:TonB-dependent receptor [Draconibacterium sediminis]KJF43955.1 TonB-dependent receptor [Draconibacterium sediminis]
MKKTRSFLIWQRASVRSLYVILLMVLWGIPSFGQNIAISGVVKSQHEGEFLPGVSIVVKGTDRGTITDADGKYSLEDVPGDGVLVFSFVGMKKTEIEVAGRRKIDVTMEEESIGLEEVVVSVGYGWEKRKNITGAVSSVNAEEISQSQSVTLEQSLQGRIPGMMVTQTSGQPGGAVSVQIRGITGFSSSGPLYVLDGVELQGIAGVGGGTNPLAGINPSDIESVDVLKDASATAIYGSKGTDGVIIITTKRGRIAPPKITYEFSAGTQQLTDKLPVMNLREFATFVNERNAGIGWGFDERPELANPEYLGEGTDWQEVLFRNAPTSTHTLTVSGGDTRTQYLLSGAYQSEEGIALGSKFERLSFRLNLDNKTTNWLKIGTSLQLVNIDENINSTNSSVIRAALEQTPDIAVQNNDGSWGGSTSTVGWVQQRVNPYAIALINKNEANRKQVFGNLYAEITFTKDLVLRNEASGNFTIATRDVFNPSYKMGNLERLISEGASYFNEGVYTSLKNYLTYSHQFDDKYSLKAMAGHEASLDKSQSLEASRKNYPSNNVQVINGGDPTTATNGGGKAHSSKESFFGRLNLGINDKYLFTGNIREDGASMYAEDKRWILSYSGALAWKVNNENFLKGVNKVNELKLRLGYGLTNRQAGRNYVYTSTLATVPTGVSTVSQLTQNIANPDLEWEQTESSNIGLDATFFNWRLNFSVDFYLKKTEGLAMQTSLPMYSGTAIGWNPGGLDAPWVNVGSMENKGFDFRISSTNIQARNFTWKTDLTVSRNINKVLKLNADGAPIMGRYSKTVVGRSIGDFYGYVVDGGVFASAIDVFGDEENGIKPHARPVKNGEILPFANAAGSIWYGDLKFKDLNGDGIIDEKDQTYLGSPIPKVQMGLNNTFNYRNFDLNVFLSASIGNKVFNELRVTAENPRSSFGYFNSLSNYAKLELIDPEGSDTDPYNVIVTNPDTDIPGVRNDNTNDNLRFSDKFIEDGSFVRCKTISLGYTFSENLLSRAHISALRVYANVTNAFTITKYSGMDPEVGSWDPINAGIDNGYYPQARRFTLGLNITLSK